MIASPTEKSTKSKIKKNRTLNRNFNWSFEALNFFFSQFWIRRLRGIAPVTVTPVFSRPFRIGVIRSNRSFLAPFTCRPWAAGRYLMPEEHSSTNLTSINSGIISSISYFILLDIFLWIPFYLILKCHKVSIQKTGSGFKNRPKNVIK